MGGTGRRTAEQRNGLEMLERSHARMGEQLGVLHHGASGLVRGNRDAECLASIDAALAFLEGPGARHELDEEASLFPRLRRYPDIAPLVIDLMADHERHRTLLTHLRSLRSMWSSTGPDAAAGAAFAHSVTELVHAYRRHIEREDHHVLPVARDRLDARDVTDMTAEMHGRREGNRGQRGERRRAAEPDPSVAAPAVRHAARTGVRRQH